MSEPLRITCNSIAEIPSVIKLRQLATPKQHIVLQFPLEVVGKDFDKLSIIEALTPQLLDYSVFDSGQRNNKTFITIMKVLDEETILENAEVFTQAIDRYLNLADELLYKLAQKHGINIGELENFRLSEKFTDSTGNLDEHWTYFFHGLECRFQNTTTKQKVDIKLRRASKQYTRVDPFFFGEYVHSSAQEQKAASLIKHNFHDSLRILEVLSENGYLED
jgi:hypothetical protein